MSSEKDKPSVRQRALEPQPGIIAEFLGFLRHNKKWWLTPILLALMGLSLIAILTGSAAAPFIYSFF